MRTDASQSGHWSLNSDFNDYTTGYLATFIKEEGRHKHPSITQFTHPQGYCTETSYVLLRLLSQHIVTISVTILRGFSVMMTLLLDMEDT